MSGDRRTLFWRFVVCCLLYILSFARVAHNLPNHGGQLFLGFNYWDNRYSLGYNTDWAGFWNNNNDGRVQYNRANSEFNGQSCGGCSCDDQTAGVSCTGSTV